MFYQAALLVQIKDELVTPSLKESVDQLIRNLSFMAEEKARYESQSAAEDGACPVLFDADVSSSSVLDQDRLTKENKELRRENAKAEENVTALQNRCVGRRWCAGCGM